MFKLKNKDIKIYIISIFWKAFLKNIHQSDDIISCLKIMKWLPLTLRRLLDVAPAYLSVLNFCYSHVFIMKRHTSLLSFPHTYQTCSCLRAFGLALPSAWCPFPILLSGCLFLILPVPSEISPPQDCLAWPVYTSTPLPSSSPSQGAVNTVYKGLQCEYSSFFRPDDLDYNDSRFLS